LGGMDARAGLNAKTGQPIAWVIFGSSAGHIPSCPWPVLAAPPPPACSCASSGLTPAPFFYVTWPTLAPSIY
jgi:hypothetical protein